MSGTLDAGVRADPGAEGPKEDSPNLVSLRADADAKWKDVSFAAWTRNESSWLAAFLADGAEGKRYDPFGPQNRIRISLLGNEEEEE
jgi:hypothetical protein